VEHPSVFLAAILATALITLVANIRRAGMMAEFDGPLCQKSTNGVHQNP